MKNVSPKTQHVVHPLGIVLVTLDFGRNSMLRTKLNDKIEITDYDFTGNRRFEELVYL
jgi:hypothetical protein